MIFSSYKFIFVFLPIAYIGYLLLGRLKKPKAIKIWLVAMSLFFYAQGSSRFLVMFLGTVVINYFIGTRIAELKIKGKDRMAKIVLILGITENLAILGYYKYTNFFLENINMLLRTDILQKNILLSLGISFFTFQLVSYIIDTYKNDLPRYNFVDYLVMVTFFPKLIVGPIVDSSDMISQIENKEIYSFNSKNVMFGIVSFCIGCAKKVIIADPLIVFAQKYYNNTDASGFFESWTAVFSYTFAYYFDFSGYIDMAIGLGLLFNIVLPKNFDSPYKARNFADFWRRWNITISKFLYKYVFGSIYKFGNRFGKLIFATMITFIVSGLWHGAGWTFILWGIANGIFVCMANYMELKQKRLPFLLAWGLTFFGSILVRVLFDSHTISQAVKIYYNMFNIKVFTGISDFIETFFTFANKNIEVMLLIIVSGIITFGFKNTDDMFKRFEPNWNYALLAGSLLAISLFRMGTISNFLYFQF